MIRIQLLALALAAACLPIRAAEDPAAADPIAGLRARSAADIRADRTDSLVARFDSLRALAAGPELFENERWKGIGFLQTGLMHFGAHSQDKEDLGLRAVPDFAYPTFGAGFILDWKALGEKDGIRLSYLGPRFRYVYNRPGLGETIPGLAGGIHALSLELSLTGRETQRLF